MFGQPKRNHLGRVVAVLALIQLSAISGLPDGAACLRAKAGLYIQRNGGCPTVLPASANAHCENEENVVTCGLREGNDTIVVLAKESQCNSTTLVIGDRHVPINLMIDSYNYCPRYKIGSFNIWSDQERQVSLGWSLPGNTRCNASFLVACK